MSKTLRVFKLGLGVFVLLIAGAAMAQPSWVRHDIVKNLTNVYALYPVDMDKDGRMDFLSASRVGARWWRNNGNGTFSSNTIGGLEGAWAVVGDDVDGDGDIDVAAASPHPDAQQMRFWKNNNGSWQAPKILPLLEAEDLCFADLDGDGVKEILGVAWAEDLPDPGNDLVYYKNYLNGSGDSVTVDPNLSGAHSVTAADFDKDGDVDLVASGDGRIKVCRNESGVLAPPKEISRSGALCVNAYDIDGDGDLDFTAQGRNPPNQNVYWWERTSDLNFVQHLVGTNIGECWAVHAGDLDGDGDMDITAASQTFRTIRAYINNGNQQFTEQVVVENFGTTNGARYAIQMDVDNDGDADIIGAAPGTGAISWFESTGTPGGGGSEEPTITSFTPGSGPVGTEATLSGTNFNGTTQVTFNSSSALFFVDSNTRIRATVPAGATTGRIRVVTLVGTASSATDFTVRTGGGGGETTVTFTPIHDANTKSSKPTSSFGSSSVLRVRKSSADNMNTYLKFDVTGVITVQRATLRLYVTDDGNDAGRLYLVSNTFNGSSTTWKQSTLNWNNAPVISGTALSSVGSVSVGSWIEFDVTSAVSGNGVYSFALTNNSSNTVGFSSREGANRPQLVIEGTALTLATGDDLLDAETSGPNEFSLAQNYPNPFNLETQIVFQMPTDELVQLTVFDILGRQVAVLVNATLQAGRHQITWEGRDANGLRVSSGMYFYQLRAPNFVASKRMLLVQ